LHRGEQFEVERHTAEHRHQENEALPQQLQRAIDCQAEVTRSVRSARLGLQIKDLRVGVFWGNQIDVFLENGNEPTRMGPGIRRMNDPTDLQEMGEHLPTPKQSGTQMKVPHFQ
jgi:hypothetical protein